ncbi:hypothetical protein ACFT5D_07745 [Streptomyces sp. NPDC057144]|uniref:hypothetical protein n=1 Tax=Streptomyces sp. NPDC057144 TaxID=3346034 RepID=UPI00363C6F05
MLDTIVTSFVRLSFVLPLVVLGLGLILNLVKTRIDVRKSSKEAIVIGLTAGLFVVSVPVMQGVIGLGSAPYQFAAVVIVYILTIAWAARAVSATRSK